ncbi:hypothetical protein VNO77_38907 [Canavalia gladiata]|uniref:Uncharacterized protein n=1 Tax=Canavalia gladiata TaxID=3824 RepID=A0AAN9PXA0_CANGL
MGFFHTPELVEHWTMGFLSEQKQANEFLPDLNPFVLAVATTPSPCDSSQVSITVKPRFGFGLSSSADQHPTGYSLTWLLTPHPAKHTTLASLFIEISPFLIPSKACSVNFIEIPQFLMGVYVSSKSKFKTWQEVTNLQLQPVFCAWIDGDRDLHFWKISSSSLRIFFLNVALKKTIS